MIDDVGLPGANPSWVFGVAAGCFALSLLAIGYLAGRRRRSKRGAGVVQPGAAATLGQDDRERIADLLHDLAAWTLSYTGSVNQFDREVTDLSKLVRPGGGGGGGTAALTTDRLVIAIDRIIATNAELTGELETARRTLEDQTRQIETYLSQARTDPLTGLANRRALDQELDERFGRFRGGGRDFTLILIDIDHFKRVNDTHGHPAGDEVLRRLAKRLGDGFSKAMVARFGGEEFAVLIDEPIDAAARRIDSLRRSLADSSIDFEGKSIPVTLSAGVASPHDETRVGSLVRRADEALYAAKRVGRNRVYVDPGNGPHLLGSPETA